MKKLFILLITMIYSFGIDISTLKSYQADFLQTIVNPQGKSLEYKGKIYILYPNLVLWNYKSPIEKDIYIKWDRVTIIEPELEQAIITTMQKQINMIDLFKNAKKVSQNHYETIFQNKLYRLDLDNNIVKSISYDDDLDNKVLIKFTNIKQNQKIKESTFDYIIPFEYDIIRK